MQQESSTVLSYARSPAKRKRKPIAAGFFPGYLIGVPIGAVMIAERMGGVGIVVPMICVGTVILGLPVFGLVWVAARSGVFGNALAFLIGIGASVATAFGLLAAFIYSYHDC